MTEINKNMILIDRITWERIQDLHPWVRPKVIDLIIRCSVQGLYIRVVSAGRSYSEQNELYAQGRTMPGAVVTNAKGGWSWHNFYCAIDFCLLNPNFKNVSWSLVRDLNENNKADWYEVIEVAKNLGFTAGADWPKPDCPHLDMRFGKTIEEIRSLFNAGKLIDNRYIDFAA